MLENKVALITGCSRGIGQAIMLRYAQEGAIVYANARQEGCLAEIAHQVNKTACGCIIPVYFDVTDKASIKKYIMQIKKEQGNLDILVNNAGIMKDAYLYMVDDKTIEETFAVNVFALIHITQLALKIMKTSQAGSIINMASIVGERGNVGQSVYAASKGAVLALTKTWARELAEKNIRVNAIAPGKIETDLFKAIGEKRIAEQINDVTMGRLGHPEDVAEVAVFLASDKSAYITGEAVGVNGGWFL